MVVVAVSDMASEAGDINDQISELDASLEDLVSDIIQSRSLHPPQSCHWYDLEDEERRQLVLERIDEALSVTEEDEDEDENAFLTYPSVRDWANVHYQLGYGLMRLQSCLASLETV